jgi:diguanylate cyclase
MTKTIPRGTLDAPQSPAVATRPVTGAAATIAKATLQRLAQARLEPTPENYARAWAESGGAPVESTLPVAARSAIEKLAARALPEDRGRQGELVQQVMLGRWAAASHLLEAGSGGGTGWAALIEQLVRGLERGGRVWTMARKKESLQRVIDSSRADGVRLRERLGQLAHSWERDVEESPSDGSDMVPLAPTTRPGELSAVPEAASSGAAAVPRLDADFVATVQAALPPDEPAALRLSQAFDAQVECLTRGAANAQWAQDVSRCNAEARDLFAHRHHLVGELGRLVRELTEGLTELAEDASWAQGQAEALRGHLGETGGVPSVRGVRAAGSLLAQTRRQQLALKGERDRAREALRALVAGLLEELSNLGGQTGRFGSELEQYTATLESTQEPAALAALVRGMLGQARAVQSEVAGASSRLAAGQAQAQTLTARVIELETELRRLSEEVSTDALTQIANRRGLQQAFEVERARSERSGDALAVGLIDIDNFKRLNDSLGHAVGDEALKALAAQVRDALRPVDHVARFGGEEFVVLLPGTPAAEAREVLTRLQRTLSVSLFMHEGREVFVTFSAGVTTWRAGESLDGAIERADAALYEAKRTGKNRTCEA